MLGQWSAPICSALMSMLEQCGLGASDYDYGEDADGSGGPDASPGILMVMLD